MPEELKFENGKFRLTEVSSEKLRLRLRTNPYWKSLPDDAFETDSLREAARFRKLADKKVERIFQRTFQVHYPETPLPDSLLKILDAHQNRGHRVDSHQEEVLSRSRARRREDRRGDTRRMLRRGRRAVGLHRPAVADPELGTRDKEGDRMDRPMAFDRYGENLGPAGRGRVEGGLPDSPGFDAHEALGLRAPIEAEDEASRRGRGVTSQGMHQREVHRILRGTHEGYVLLRAVPGGASCRLPGRFPHAESPDGIIRAYLRSLP